MKRILKPIKNNPSLWKAIKLRFLTIIFALSATYFITGSPIASISVTSVQQSGSFVIHYLFEENERKKPKEKEVESMPEEYKKHLPDHFLR